MDEFDQEPAAQPEAPQIAPSEQNGDATSDSHDEGRDPVAADSTEPEAELTEEQKNERILKEREERSRRSQNGVQRRFKELADAADRERKRAESAERRNDAILQRLLGQGPAQQQGTQGNGEPQRTDPQFAGDYERYLDARTEWRAQQIVQAQLQNFSQSWQQNAAQQQHQVQAQRMAEEFGTKLSTSAKAIPNFLETIRDNEDVEVGNALPAILEAENPAAVMMYLAQNHRAAERIANLSPIGAAREIGRLETALKGKPQLSNAPAPGNPVGARPGSSSAPPENPDAYMAWAAKNMR